MKNFRIFSIMLAGLLLVVPVSMAGDDPSIKGKLREDIGHSMSQFIQSNTMNGQFVVYDSVEGKLLKLDLEKLHTGIV